MPLQTKVSGAWKHVRSHVKVNGAWKEAPQVYTKVNGTWRPLYSFEWETGSWGTCSATCGGGTQTRTVRAKRDDGQYFSDTVGTALIGTKPATSQECNTQSCTEYGGDNSGWSRYTSYNWEDAGCVSYTSCGLSWNGTNLSRSCYIDFPYTTGGYRYYTDQCTSSSGGGTEAGASQACNSKWRRYSCTVYRIPV